MIRLHIPGVPPSVNHAYTEVHGRKILSAAGRRYIAETKAHLVQTYPRDLQIFKPNKPYLIFFRFFFPNIENKNFLKGKGETRYKVIDLTNRVKLLEDCLKDAGGIDDSQHLQFALEKKQGEEKTDILVWSLEDEETPFDYGFNL